MCGDQPAASDPEWNVPLLLLRQRHVQRKLHGGLPGAEPHTSTAAQWGHAHKSQANTGRVRSFAAALIPFSVLHAGQCTNSFTTFLFWTLKVQCILLGIYVLILHKPLRFTSGLQLEHSNRCLYTYILTFLVLKWQNSEKVEGVWIIYFVELILSHFNRVTIH